MWRLIAYITNITYKNLTRSSSKPQSGLFVYEIELLPSANIDSEEGRNLNIPASFKMMKKQNFLPQTSTASNVNQSHNIPQEIYDDILNLKLNLEKEVMLRKKLEEEYSIELGR
ncbi:uncharacterized protein LOC113466956 [Diaphorina citri]|uniref:Uncharacterized protein LOC113466956 n=1 Tax=Diaphorina citri TaxID=121845 RepID=A0A3Q0IQP3_DIACI|nr:uncharacterized protein LOC113466956 [Diaphorina citri]